MQFNAEKIIHATRYPAVIMATLVVFLELDRFVKMFHAHINFGFGGFIELFVVAVVYAFLTHFLFPDPVKYVRHVRERKAVERGGGPLDRQPNGDYHQ